MRNLVIALSALLVTSSSGQVWEKVIVPGVTYRMEVELNTPRIVHALRLSRGAPGLDAKPEVAGFHIYDESPSKGRQELSTLLKQQGVIAAINGDFFPFTGDPLGAMIKEGELISIPFKNRPVFGWGNTAVQTAVLGWSGSLIQNQTIVKVNGLNQECSPDEIVINTRAAGLAVAKAPSLYAAVKLQDQGALLPPDGRLSGEIELFYTDVDKMPVQPGYIILAARGKSIPTLAKLKRKEPLTIETRLTGMDWAKIRHAIGGGPTLLLGGKPQINWKEAGFDRSFAMTRHPRTAVGNTPSGDIWLVAVDGRQKISAGATLSEMAEIMQKLGCTEAINLDGGGSTTFGLIGHVLNRPSGGVERKIANALVLTGELPDPVAEQMVLKGANSLPIDGEAQFEVIGSDGKSIPHSEIIWSAQGSGWIDQGGTLRPLQAGQIRLKAIVRGNVIEGTINVDPTCNSNTSR